MITDRLDLCPFCSHKLVKRESEACDLILDCPNQQKHLAGFLWAWFDDRMNPNFITTLNIRVGRYQLWWSIRRQQFALIDTETSNLDNHLFTIDKLIDFPLSKEEIEKKIKTMLIFL